MKYNITEKERKEPGYRLLMSPDRVDQIYEQILHKMTVEKKYRDPDYSAKQMAIELNTNTRYISAVVSLRFQKNYASMVNDYRIQEAMYLLIDPRHQKKTIEEIGQAVGFANRQSFYAAFYRVKGITPNEYRKK